MLKLATFTKHKEFYNNISSSSCAAEAEEHTGQAAGLATTASGGLVPKQKSKVARCMLITAPES
jgi:hypothetical protein